MIVVPDKEEEEILLLKFVQVCGGQTAEGGSIGCVTGQGSGNIGKSTT